MESDGFTKVAENFHKGVIFAATKMKNEERTLN